MPRCSRGRGARDEPRQECCALHPADEFTAFKAMFDEEAGLKDIAANHGPGRDAPAEAGSLPLAVGPAAHRLSAQQARSLKNMLFPQTDIH